jgi:hypothetical protein
MEWLKLAVGNTVMKLEVVYKGDGKFVLFRSEVLGFCCL